MSGKNSLNGKGISMNRNLSDGFLNALKVNSSVLIPLIILLVIAGIFVPKFATFTNAMSLLRSMSTTALIAFPMTFVLISGGIDLTVGAMQAFAGAITTVLFASFGVPSVIAILIALVCGAMLGLLNGIIITKLKMPPFIVTIAMMYVIRGFAYIFTGGLPVSVPKDDFFIAIGQGYIGEIPITVIYVVVAFLLLWWILNRTKFGRHIFAVGGNHIAAEYSGINVNKTLTKTYVYTGLLAAFAGVILSSRLNSGQPTIGEGSELDIIAACIVGGLSMEGGAGTLAGTLMGALIVTAMANILNLLGLGSFVQMVAKGAIMILFVYVSILRKNAQLKARKQELK